MDDEGMGVGGIQQSYSDSLKEVSTTLFIFVSFPLKIQTKQILHTRQNKAMVLVNKAIVLLNNLQVQGRWFGRKGYLGLGYGILQTHMCWLNWAKAAGE